MRGRTLKNSFAILDEAQNATDTQIKMFLTRIGENSKLLLMVTHHKLIYQINHCQDLIDQKKFLGHLKEISM